jgi:hypothetical protein
VSEEMATSEIESMKQRFSIWFYDGKPMDPIVRDQIAEYLRENTMGLLRNVSFLIGSQGAR